MCIRDRGRFRKKWLLSKLIKMRVFKQKELLFSMSDTEPLLRTSYNQQEAGTTKEERSVLLYNNR